MDFVMSNEHKMARQLFREFAEKEVKPLAQEIDEEERFPHETVEKLPSTGLWASPSPRSMAVRAAIL